MHKRGLHPHQVARRIGSDAFVSPRCGPDGRGCGRAPAGVELDERGFVVVDDHLRTTAANTWAVGDVAGSPQFTHASWHDFRILRTNLTGGEAATTGRLVPYTVFTTPELGRVGLTEAEAREQCYRVRVASLSAGAIPRSKTLHDTVGTWKAVVVDADTDRILGVSLLGRGAGGGHRRGADGDAWWVPYQQVRDAVITHPTMAEGLNLLFDTMSDES